MRYVPRNARDGINVSKQHPLAEAANLIVGLGLLLAAAVLVLIVMVDLILRWVPVEREAALFDAWLPDDIVTVAVTDPRLAAVESLTARLASHWPDAEYTFRVEIDDSDELNALAFPGGLIVVTRGLLDAVASENELAFVLGHELGHFYNRDPIRSVGRVALLGILIAALGSGEANADLSTTIAGATLNSFSRRQENAADAFGLELVNKEYGHVADAWRFFERTQSRPDALSGIAAYFTTHPSSDQRIDALKKLASHHAWRATGRTRGLPWDAI